MIVYEPNQNLRCYVKVNLGILNLLAITRVGASRTFLRKTVARMGTKYCYFNPGFNSES